MSPRKGMVLPQRPFQSNRVLTYTRLFTPMIHPWPGASNLPARSGIIEMTARSLAPKSVIGKDWSGEETCSRGIFLQGDPSSRPFDGSPILIPP